MKFRFPNSKHTLSLISRFASEFVNRVSSFIVFPLMLKYLSAEAYGVNTQIQTLSSYLLTFAGLGLGFFVIREYSGKLEKTVLSKRFWSSIMLVGTVSIIVGSILLVFTDQLNTIFFKATWANSVIQWGFGLIFFSAIEQVIRDFLRARLRMIAYSTSQIVQAVIYVGGVSAILINGGDLLQIMQLTVGLRAASCLGMVIFLLVVGEINFSGGLNSLKEQSEIARWGLPIVASSLSVAFISTGDRAILGALTDSVSVGIYGASYQLANVILAIGAPFWSMLYPLMATFKNSQDPAGLTKVSRKYSNAFACIGIPVFFGLLILGARTLGHFGEKLFELPMHVFLFIILGVFISQFCAPVLYLAYIYQKPKTIFAITTASALTNSILNILLIPYLGIFAAALNTTFTYALMDFLLIRLIPSTGLKEKELFDYKNILRYLISGIAMAIGLSIIRESLVFDIDTLIIMVVSSAGLYFFVLFALYGFKPSRMLKPLFD
jgi:O-antigen/teichoic acid export membrane protein